MKIRRLGVISMSKTSPSSMVAGVLVGLGIGGAIAIRRPAELAGIPPAIATVAAIIIGPSFILCWDSSLELSLRYCSILPPIITAVWRSRLSKKRHIQDSEDPHCPGSD